MKTFKSLLFKKYLKGKKLQVPFCLFLGWLHISEIFFENCNSVGAGTFGPTLTLISLIIGECKKCKIYILKKVGLTTFK